MNLKNILYFDFDKAASLVSQLEGGLAKQRSETSEETQDERKIRKYELLKVFKSEFGGIQTDKKAVIETKVLHHDLLVRLSCIPLRSTEIFSRNITMPVSRTRKLAASCER
jgi:hypothetical protein